MRVSAAKKMRDNKSTNGQLVLQNSTKVTSFNDLSSGKVSKYHSNYSSPAVITVFALHAM